MVAITRTIEDGYIICSIGINSDFHKYGLRVKIIETDSELLKETKIKAAEKALSREIFLNHKIIVEGYTPCFSDLFLKSSLDFLKKVISKQLTEKEIYLEVVKNGFKDYFYLIPVDFFKRV